MCMNLLDVKHEIEFLNTKADFYHVDIMDGHFVKNLSLSPDFVKTLHRAATIPIGCHLMVTNPENYIEVLAKAGADYITVHAETITGQAFRIINQIKACGCKVGVAINPATPLCQVQHYLHLLDSITIMTVDPGFAAQPFIPEMLDKIREAARLKKENGYHYLLGTDGACNEKTYRQLYQAGAEVFTMGSTGLFGLDPVLEKAWDKMEEIFTRETAE